MKEKKYVWIIGVLVLLLFICGYFIFIVHPQKYKDFKETMSLKEFSISNSIPISEFDLVVYEDDSYAGFLHFEHFYSDSLEEGEIPVLKVVEEETFEGYFLNLYLNDKVIDKLTLNEYSTSLEEYEEYDKEYKLENSKNKIKINSPFDMANVIVYNIKDEGFAVLYLSSIDEEGEHSVYNLNFYSYKGNKIDETYVVADDSDYSYSSFSNFKFNGNSFEYWNLDCDKNIAVKKSLQLNDGKIIKKDIDKSRSIFKNSKKESKTNSISFICD